MEPRVELPTPLEIERLEIKRQIGRGAFAQVYAGVYQGRDCAVKVLAPAGPGVPGPVFEKLFLAEASLCLTLKHRHLIECIGIVRIPSGHPSLPHLSTPTWAMVLQLCEAASLREAVVAAMALRRDYSSVMGLEWLRGVAEALHALHTASPPIIHRDVKADNVLLKREADGQVLSKLSDMGLHSRLRDHRSVMLRRRGGFPSSQETGIASAFVAITPPSSLTWEPPGSGVTAAAAQMGPASGTGADVSAGTANRGSGRWPMGQLSSSATATTPVPEPAAIPASDSGLQVQAGGFAGPAKHGGDDQRAQAVAVGSSEDQAVCRRREALFEVEDSDRQGEVKAVEEYAGQKRRTHVAAASSASVARFPDCADAAAGATALPPEGCSWYGSTPHGSTCVLQKMLECDGCAAECRGEAAAAASAASAAALAAAVGTISSTEAHLDAAVSPSSSRAAAMALTHGAPYEDRTANGNRISAAVTAATTASLTSAAALSCLGSVPGIASPPCDLPPLRNGSSVSTRCTAMDPRPSRASTTASVSDSECGVTFGALLQGDRVSAGGNACTGDDMAQDLFSGCGAGGTQSPTGHSAAAATPAPAPVLQLEPTAARGLQPGTDLGPGPHPGFATMDSTVTSAEPFRTGVRLAVPLPGTGARPCPGALGTRFPARMSTPSAIHSGGGGGGSGGNGGGLLGASSTTAAAGPVGSVSSNAATSTGTVLAGRCCGCGDNSTSVPTTALSSGSWQAAGESCGSSSYFATPQKAGCSLRGEGGGSDSGCKGPSHPVTAGAAAAGVATGAGGAADAGAAVAAGGQSQAPVGCVAVSRDTWHAAAQGRSLLPTERQRGDPEPEPDPEPHASAARATRAATTLDALTPAAAALPSAVVRASNGAIAATATTAPTVAAAAAAAAATAAAPPQAITVSYFNPVAEVLSAQHAPHPEHRARAALPAPLLNSSSRSGLAARQRASSNPPGKGRSSLTELTCTTEQAVKPRRACLGVQPSTPVLPSVSAGSYRISTFAPPRGNAVAPTARVYDAPTSARSDRCSTAAATAGGGAPKASISERSSLAVARRCIDGDVGGGAAATAGPPLRPSTAGSGSSVLSIVLMHEGSFLELFSRGSGGASGGVSDSSVSGAVAAAAAAAAVRCSQTSGGATLALLGSGGDGGGGKRPRGPAATSRLHRTQTSTSAVRLSVPPGTTSGRLSGPGTLAQRRHVTKESTPPPAPPPPPPRRPPPACSALRYSSSGTYQASLATKQWLGPESVPRSEITWGFCPSSSAELGRTGVPDHALNEPTEDRDVEEDEEEEEEEEEAGEGRTAEQEKVEAQPRLSSLSFSERAPAPQSGLYEPLLDVPVQSLSRHMRRVESIRKLLEAPSDTNLPQHEDFEWVFGLTGHAGSFMYMAPEVF